MTNRKVKLVKYFKGYRHEERNDVDESDGLCEQKRTCSFLEMNQRLPQIGDGSLTTKHVWRSVDHLTMAMKRRYW